MNKEQYVLIRKRNVIGRTYYSLESAENAAMDILSKQLMSSPITVAKLCTKLSHKVEIVKEKSE